MLSRLLEPRTDVAYTLLRFVAGLMLSFHGMQKIFGVLSPHPPAFGTQLWIGGILELVCGLAIAVGVLTVYAAFLASGMMAVAYTQFHWKLQLDANFFPVINKGELALVFAFLFLFFACRGGGPWSVDAKILRR